MQLCTRSAAVATLMLIAGLAPVELAEAQGTVVFQGRPGIKISEGGLERVPVGLSAEIAATAECVIVEENGQYFWGSRQNTLMGAVRNGAFITFVALNGTGYVRVYDRRTQSEIPLTPAEERFDYVEHILLGLRSVTYYGNEVQQESGN